MAIASSVQTCREAVAASRRWGGERWARVGCLNGAERGCLGMSKRGAMSRRALRGFQKVLGSG